MSIFGNAFKLPGHKEVTAEEKEFLISAAEKVRKRSMQDILALAIESTRPLHGIGAQGFIFISPMLKCVFDEKDVNRVSGLLENPDAVDFFISRLNL